MNIYEMRDETDDERYFVQGYFASLEEAKAVIDGLGPEDTISDYACDNDIEIIVVHEIEVTGLRFKDKRVLSVTRESTYDETTDTESWDVTDEIKA